jgi:hypothetical protein
MLTPPARPVRAWKAAAILTAAVGIVLAAAPQASAATPVTGVIPYEISVNQGGELWGTGLPPCPPCLSSEEEPIAAGTSPSVIGTPGLGYEVAFQDSNGDLWFTGALVANDDTGIKMAPGTSPSLVPLNGSFQAAWQGANGDVWMMTGPDGPIDLGVAMAPGTSPALTEMGASTAFPNGGYALAVNGSDGSLWEITPNGATDSTDPIAPGTNPAIAALSNGQLNDLGPTVKVGYQLAWHSTNGDLVVQLLRGFSDTGVTMAPGSSPSLTRWSPSVSGFALGGYDVAFACTNDDLCIFGMWTYWPYGTPFPGDTGLPMMAGSTPSLDGTILAVAGAQPAPDYYIAYASPTGEVFLETKDSGPSGVTDTGTSVASGTGPSITSLGE